MKKKTKQKKKKTQISIIFLKTPFSPQKPPFSVKKTTFPNKKRPSGPISGVKTRIFQMVFALPTVSAHPHGWGPLALPAPLTALPFRPFGRHERPGRAAELSATGAFVRGARGYSRWREQQVRVTLRIIFVSKCAA
jgi:hypothetical protein